MHVWKRCDANPLAVKCIKTPLVLNWAGWTGPCPINNRWFIDHHISKVRRLYNVLALPTKTAVRSRNAEKNKRVSIGSNSSKVRLKKPTFRKVSTMQDSEIKVTALMANEKHLLRRKNRSIEICPSFSYPEENKTVLCVIEGQKVINWYSFVFPEV